MNNDEKDTSCKYCGKTGLNWQGDDEDGWVLMEGKYKVHRCDPKLMAKVQAERFEDLTK